MDEQGLLRWLEMILGILIIVIVLLDVFVTVLYARIGASAVTHRLSSLVWTVFHGTANLFKSSRQSILVFCGPVIIAVLIAFWMLGLAFGAALVIHPNLGYAVRSTIGETPKDFMTALFAGGGSIDIVGSGEFAPHTSAFRLFYLLNSLAGAVLISLLVKYLLELYSSLKSRNAFGSKLHSLSSETNDAADLLAGLGAQGHFDSGYTNLAAMSSELVDVKESHHFFPVLFYFRFRESYYSVSQSTLMCLDLVTLTKSALNDQEYGWLKESTSIAELWSASMTLLTDLSDTFLPDGTPEAKDAPDEAVLNRWHHRYNNAIKRLQQAGIKTIEDEQVGFDIYKSLRKEWEPIIEALAPMMAYKMEEVDPSSYTPQKAEKRADFRSRLHTVQDI